MKDISELRAQLDEADQRILNSIADRFNVIRAIAQYKSATHMPMMQPDRVALVKDRYAQAASSIGIPADRLREVAAALIAAACDLEIELMSGAAEPPKRSAG